MSTPRRISWPLLGAALLCLVPVVAGGYLVVDSDSGGEALGFGLLGFFGAGTVVLGRKALGR